MRDDDVNMRKIARELRTPVRVSDTFDARVMDAVRALPRHRRFGLWSRLTTPRARTVTFAPLSYGLLAAAVAAFAVLGAVHAASDLHRAAQPIVTALNVWAFLHQPDMPLQRNDFITGDDGVKRITLSWEYYTDKESTGHVLVQQKKPDGSPLDARYDSATVLYSERKF